MDELVIGEQRYISSKRAAEITGYAKDYIGQLCREGRVEARLVGRSWYVREAAIKDHRFGAENDPVSAVTSGAVVEAEKEWSSPKYEAEVVEELPVSEKEEDPVDTAQRIQEAWQAWFAQNKAKEEAPVPIEIERIQESEAEIEPPPVSETVEEEAETPVLITRVEEPVEDLEPEPEQLIQEERPLRIVGMPTAAPKRSYFGLRIALVVLGVSAMLISSLGTGYLVLPRLPMVAAVIDALSGERFVEK